MRPHLRMMRKFLVIDVPSMYGTGTDLTRMNPQTKDIMTVAQENRVAIIFSYKPNAESSIASDIFTRQLDSLEKQTPLSYVLTRFCSSFGKRDVTRLKDMAGATPDNTLFLVANGSSAKYLRDNGYQVCSKSFAHEQAAPKSHQSDAGTVKHHRNHAIILDAVKSFAQPG